MHLKSTTIVLLIAAALPGFASAQSAGAGPQTGNLLNPNISVIGTFVGTAGHSPEITEPAFHMREAELGFQSQVDPYSRADFFISVNGEGGTDLEEGYLQFPALAPGLGGKIGKFRMDLGKFNRTHAPETPFADRPLAGRRFFGEEGLAGTGAALSYLIPNPLDLYANLDLEAVNTPAAAAVPAFDTARRGDLLYLAHLSVYDDLTEALNATLGLTAADGANGMRFDAATASSTTLRTQLAAADLTVRWKNPERAIYRSVVWQTEAYWLRPEPAAGPTPTRQGAFSYVDWQFARRWHLGLRGDASQTLSGSAWENGGLVFLTFTPTEFSLMSLQARETRYADGSHENVGWLKMTFNIGPHGAHPF